MREHVTDEFVKRAKQQGYRSRAAFKLLEIDQRDRLLMPGMTVVDLGAAPGSWSQVVCERIGAKGKVIALDILAMAPLKDVTFIQADFSDPAALAKLEELLKGYPIDLVISDMAPNISGINSVDQARVMSLAELALEFAQKSLKPGGDFLVKVFQGQGYEEFLREMRSHFSKVASRKPQASRGRSNEIYVLGRAKF